MTASRSQGWPVGTIVRGNVVMWEGEIIDAPAGRPMAFTETLPVRLASEGIYHADFRAIVVDRTDKGQAVAFRTLSEPI